MIDNENEFFEDIKNDNFEEENISSSGINYGQHTEKNGTKNILIAISAGAVVAAVLVLLLSSGKKSSDVNNLAEIPTISQPSEPIKIEPITDTPENIFENTSIYENPTILDVSEKEVTTPQKIIIKPSQPAKLPKKAVKKATPVKKVQSQPKVETKVEVKKPTITSYKEEKFVETKTGIPGEVELSLTPSPLKKSTGIWNIQLVSTSTETAAKTEWETLSKKYPSILGGHSHTINKTDVNGKTYYRLRVSNLSTSEEATKICNQLKAYKVSCFVVK